MKKTIEELLKNKMESELDTYPMVIENSVDDVLEVIMPVINAEIQKEREDAIKASNELVNKIWDWFEPKLKKEREDAIKDIVKDIVKDIKKLKLKEQKIDYSYVNIPEEWEAEPENIEKRGYNQAVREINNKIYLFITNNLSQTKGDKK